MSDIFMGSQAPLYQNVKICRRSKTGKILEERFAKNRVTRLMLYGIGKFLLGHYNNSTPDKIYEVIPRYLALGTNTPGVDYKDAGVTTISSVNDTRLLNEIKYASTTGASESVKRIWIAERNMCKLNTKFSDDFIKISIKAYISSNHYDGMSIGEAGLFSKEKDNNCLARVCFSPIVKNPGEVLDIQWDITLLSYGETKYPEKLQIDNGSKITLPLKYTNRHFKTINTGLYIDKIDKTIGTNMEPDLFTYRSDGSIISTHSLTELKQSNWYINIHNLGLEPLFETMVKQLLNSTLDNTTDPYYLIDDTQHIPNMFHFGNLYSTVEDELISKNALCITLLFNEEYNTNNADTKWRYTAESIEGNYVVYSPKEDDSQYKIVGNRFYKRDEFNTSIIWKETNAFIYHGSIVNINQEFLGYTYSNGKFFKTETKINDIILEKFLNYSNIIDSKTLLADEKLYLYKFDNLGTIQRTNISIDYNEDQKIYDGSEYTDYHLSDDNYWVTGEYEKLTPILTPKDSTDRSVTWYIQNKDIAKINWDGVVTAWNLGETTAIASTTNDLRAKCIVDVVKESKYIAIDSITLDPTSLIFIVEDVNQSEVVTANVEPLFATNPTVNWTVSSELSNCISLINIGDNRVKVVLNGSGNIASGYITATSQSGKSAECFVQILYSAKDKCDCDDESHYRQKSNH